MKLNIAAQPQLMPFGYVCLVLKALLTATLWFPTISHPLRYVSVYYFD